MSNQARVTHRLAAPRVAFGLALVLLSWGLLAAAVAGQTSAGTNLASAGSATEASAETLEARLAEARANLAALAPDAAAWTNAPSLLAAAQRDRGTGSPQEQQSRGSSPGTDLDQL
jgi:hypothetical protein